MTEQTGPDPAYRADPVPEPTSPRTSTPMQPTSTQDPADRTTSAPVEASSVSDRGEPTRKKRRAARNAEIRHDLDGPQHEVVDPAHAKFGGVNLGACFFGWIVAIGMTILLAGIVGAVVTAISSRSGVTQSEAERQSGTIGLATAIVLLVVLALGYYAGGYVAGRMSRFDGGRQGIAVWALGLLVTLVALGLGAIFGNEYNVLDRVDLPRVYLSDSQIGWGAVVTALTVLIVTLLTAWLGGVVGRRYHSRVDRVAGKAWEEAADGR